MAWMNSNNLRYADDFTLLQKVKRNERASWWEWMRWMKKLAENSSLKNYHDDIQSYHFIGNRGKKWKQWQIFSSWALTSLWTVTAAMKSKDACLLKAMTNLVYWKAKTSIANKSPSRLNYGLSKSFEIWTIEEEGHWIIDAFKLWCWRRLLRVFYHWGTRVNT